MGGFEVSEAPRDSFIDAYNNADMRMSGGTTDYGSEHFIEESEEESETNVEFNLDGSSDANQNTDEFTELARKESALVRTWRFIVLAVILVTGAVVTSMTYVFLKREEEDDYRVSYNLFTHTVRDASDGQFKDFKLAVFGMAETVTAAGRGSSRPFPYVRVPMFEVPASQMREMSGVEMFSWNPIVDGKQRNEWKNFTLTEQGWLDESREINMKSGLVSQAGPIRTYIWYGDPAEIAPDPGPFLPLWMMSPPPFSPDFINYNMMAEPYIERMLPIINTTREGVMSEINPTLGRLAGIAVAPQDHEDFHDQYVNKRTNANESAFDHPHSVHMQPVFNELDETSPFVGFLASVVPWDRYLGNLLPTGVNGIYAVVRNTCNQSYTYVLNGNRADYKGEGDTHDRAYDDTEVVVPLTKYDKNETRDIDGHCVYSFSLYSSDTFKAESESNLPLICTICVAVIFALMAIVFCVYDQFVRRRNTKVVKAAARSNAIVSSLFPSQVRDRLFAEKEEKDKQDNAKNQGPQNLKTILNSDEFFMNPNGDVVDDDDDFMYKTKPIADLFPETTILFADIAGFTAWSSVREPTQVFILLETLYKAYDDIAKKRRVFKVETVGDCYVAVTGLPDPRKDHAVAMCRFARDCLLRTRALCRKLEVTLGPDTGDLAMRMGIHSGPVTAGVLRGERSRFQLFGDTMNTAARMEHTGVRDKIQLSQETADRVIAAGKTNWLSLREDIVYAKGKGEMQTYWLELSKGGGAQSTTDQSSSGGSSLGECERFESAHSQAAGNLDAKTMRLIGWNVDVLLRLLKQVVARREACPVPPEATPPNEARFKTETASNTLDEVKEIIRLPKFNAQAAMQQEDPENVTLDPAVVQQLHDYVCNIASMYRDNSFHNFEHASHVTMSVVKLMSRIVAPSDVIEDRGGNRKDLASSLHDHTYGITSDPLTQFACVYSALVHDVDHTGVPNAQLVKEGTEAAQYYKNKSVAEQNSVDLAWIILMDDDYADLRRAIYQTDSELKRFRQLVVNSVMATDIVDKQLKALRNQRWDRAFSEVTQDLDSRDTTNRKATIVIEHLIQASDVAHTMQHWHIYRKWNERFFLECYQAYKDGRAEHNPAENWYQGEIGFFDFYIIPLARKLKDCGVFGVASDEYLNYATKNRVEWEAKGREVVDEMVELATGKASINTTAQASFASLPQKEEASARPA